jgi:hypothetical protein
VDFPEDEALKLLAKAQGKVREVKTDWLVAWRELAVLTSGITTDDPRLPSTMNALNECDNAFQKGDWLAFERAAEQVRAAVHR